MTIVRKASANHSEGQARPGLAALATVARLKNFWIVFGAIVAWAILSRLALNAHSYFDAEDALFYSLNIRALNFREFDGAGSGWQILCTAIDRLLPAASEPTLAGKLVARVFGTLLLPLLYVTLAIVTRRVALSAAMTLFFSGAFGPWWYSLQPDKYVPQLFIIAVALALVMTREKAPTARFLIGLGFVYFAAVTFHSASGLICFSILPLLFRTLRGRGIWSAFKQGLLTASVMFALLAIYYVLFLLVLVRPADEQGVREWLMSYLSTPGQTQWGHWTIKSPLLAFVGISRSVFAVEFAFAFPAVVGQMHAQFPNKILVEEEWFAAHLPSWLSEVGPMLFCLALLAIFAVVLAAAYASRSLLREDRRRDRHAVASVLCYLVPAAVFFDWWEPINNEFWIAPWYAAVLLFGIVISGKDWRFAAKGVAVCAIALISFNGLLGVIPRLDKHSDYWLARQEPIARAAQRDDLIVENGFMAASYMEFIGPAKVFRIDFYAQNQATLKRLLLDKLVALPGTRSVFLTDLVTGSAGAKPVDGPKPNESVIAHFVESLPPPAEWTIIDGRRLARYDAARLRTHLAQD
ncbi:hypothetical protein [Bradyrhizobium sp. CB3481]|uniref:hypothetical protein n=1 Tax=Bradyrhizobium sp. CB3481 TaxID=3039158 RepID=UPI0024B101F5|nr:hypothetical protein [Bradyrhizobium sp. CB3481]WFU18778.1 hypothetical protein QA643_10800 [Bradyrhizobium sp. CB3481]